MAELNEDMIVKGKDWCRVKVGEELYEFDRKTEELIRVFLDDKAEDAHKIEIVFLKMRSYGDPIESVFFHPMCYLPPVIILILLIKVTIVSDLNDLERCLLDIYNISNISGFAL